MKKMLISERSGLLVAGLLLSASIVLGTGPADTDGDGYLDSADNCRLIANDQTDTDGDGLGDDCDMCADSNAGLADGQRPITDQFGCSLVQSCPCYGPVMGTASWKSHGKYVGCVRRGSRLLLTQRVITKADRHALLQEARIGTSGLKCGRIHGQPGDRDGDGIADDVDNCPKRRNIDQKDQDGDGIGDICDPDLDDDLVNNRADNCPHDKNADQVDADGDGVGDACDKCKDTTEDADVDASGCD